MRKPFRALSATTCATLFLLGAILTWLVIPVYAQETSGASEGVALRAAYKGSFLPEGTRIVVLARQARTERNGRLQPEFIGMDAYPREARLIHRRDVLDHNGFSSRSYVPTGTSGLLYYLYAFAPDSTVYWSYSAQRDSLKYDVVSTGVMSVAPIFESDIRMDVLRRYFGPRVRVRMPNEEEEESGDDDALAIGDEETDDAASSRAADSAGVSGFLAVGSPERDEMADGAAADLDAEARSDRSASNLAADLSSDQSSAGPGDVTSELPGTALEQSAASGPADRRALRSNLPLALPALLTLVAGAAGLIFARRQRAEVRSLRLEAIGLRERARMAESAEALRAELAALRNEHESLRRELDETRAQRRDLLCDHAALQQRCAALEAQLEAHREGAA